MSRRRSRPGLPLLISLGLLALAPGVARAGWSRPFSLTAPGTLDVLPPQLAVSGSGLAATGFAILDVDTPGTAQAYLVQRTASGAVGAARQIGGAQEILALGYAGSGLELLTGASPSGLECCSSAQLVRVGPGGVIGRPQTVVGGLAGSAVGRVVGLAGGRSLVAVATGRGVWVASATARGRATGLRRLTSAGEAPQALSAAALDGESSLVAWTAATGAAGSADPRSVFYALGTRRGFGRSRVLVSAASPRRIEELAVAERGKSATAAWIESGYDPDGGYHAQVRAADLATRPQPQSFSTAGGAAAGLVFGSAASGAQALAWKACDGGGACTVRVATRGPRTAFRAPLSMGPIGASQTPALSVSSRGAVVVGWVRAGRPTAVVGAAQSGRFGPQRVLSPSVYALDETVAFGAHGALAVWSQGTLAPSVVAAAYR